MAGKHRKPDPARPLIPAAAGATVTAVSLLTTTATLPAIPVTKAAVVTKTERQAPRPAAPSRPAMMLAPPMLAPASVELAPGPPRVLTQWTPAPTPLMQPGVAAQPMAAVTQPAPQQRTLRAVTRAQQQAPIGLHRAPEPAEAPAPAVQEHPVTLAARAVTAAISQVGSKYVWGGSAPGAFDCSGLVQWAYRQAGISLPRTAAAQAGVGRLVGISELRPGDLLFYAYGGDVEHVTMYVGNGQIAEASTFGVPVHVRPLYTNGLSVIKRLIN